MSDPESSPLRFRAGTDDEAIFRAVVMANEYDLPRLLDEDDVVLDVGAHVGSFCYAALRRGARRVMGFEADGGNAALAAENLAGFGNCVQITHAAVWRSDMEVERLHLARPESRAATGGGNVVFRDQGEPVRAVALDTVIARITERWGRPVRFLKLDCEAAEFPILLTSRLLGSVEEIGGEFHELGGEFDPHTIPERCRIPGVERFTIDVLAGRLEGEGFEVRWRRHPGTNLGLFSARKPHRVRWGNPIRRLWRWIRGPFTVGGRGLR